MKMTSLAKFFRFCGYGVATTSVLLGIAAIVALNTIGPEPAFIIGLNAVVVLFIFSVSWIIMSYRLEREGAEVDRKYHEAVEELEKFRRDSRVWYLEHGIKL